MLKGLGLSNLYGLLWTTPKMKAFKKEIDKKEAHYGILAVCFLLVIGSFTWTSGWNYITLTDAFQQYNRTKLLMLSTMSHLTYFDNIPEMKSAFVDVQAYIDSSLQAQDFDSVRRDLETKLQVMKLAISDMGLAELAQTMHEIVRHVQSIDEQAFSNIRMQQGIMMLVYNHITEDVQNELNMSSVLRASTLKNQARMYNLLKDGIHHANHAKQNLREMRQSEFLTRKVMAVDVLHGEMQIRLAKFFKVILFHSEPDAYIMLVTGAILVMLLGPNALLFISLFEHSYTHLLRLQEQVVVEDEWILEERRTEVSLGQFFVLMMTGQGCNYILMLIAIAIVMQTGRRGSGLLGLIMHLLDWVVSQMRSKNMYMWWLFAVLAGIKKTVEWIPTMFYLLLGVFVSSNCMAIVIWWLVDEPYYNACIVPVHKILASPGYWLAMSMLVLFTYITTQMSDFLQQGIKYAFRHSCFSHLEMLRILFNPSIWLAVINLLGHYCGFSTSLPSGYLFNSENCIAAITGWLYSKLVPSGCIFLGMC